MKRITAACLAMLVALILWASPVLASEFVVEMLRLDVPAAQREIWLEAEASTCLLYTSPSPRDLSTSRMPSSA